MIFKISYEPLENAAVYPDQQLFTQTRGNEHFCLFVSTKLQSWQCFKARRGCNFVFKPLVCHSEAAKESFLSKMQFEDIFVCYKKKP